MIERINERYDARIQAMQMTEGFAMANRQGIQKRIAEKQKRKRIKEMERMMNFFATLAAIIAFIDVALIIAITVMAMGA